MATFDYIIMGAGSAGCVLANRLTADPKISVLLIEAGGKDTNPWIHIPGGYFKTMHNPKTDWCFKIQSDKGLGGREMNYPRGKTLGGSSSINGLLYIRGQSQDYNYWRQLGNVGWSWEDVLPYFKKSEDNQRGTNEFHGVDGPLSVEDMRVKMKVLDTFIDAAEEFGFPRRSDFNTGENEGIGYFQVTQRNGLRCSTAVGYLNPIKHRKNLKIITQAHIKNIEFENNKAVSVNYWQDNQLKKVKANIEIILSAGSIGSPHILQASGIGPGELLKKNNVEVIKNHSAVGKNLQDHLMLRPVYRIKNLETLNEVYHSAIKKMFTGIIESLGTITKLDNRGNDIRLTVSSPTLDMSDVSLGDSIATNGVCLTVTEMGADYYCADVSAETIKLTGFAHYGTGSKVNLEKAMRPTDRLGGHIVSGHVDGVGEISKIIKHTDYIEFWVKAPTSLAKYIAHKGSITVDGISLTVNEVSGAEFMLWIIPHTLQETIMSTYKVGTRVNLEVDVIARYLERLMMGDSAASTDTKGIDMAFLAENGFLKR